MKRLWVLGVLLLGCGDKTDMPSSPDAGPPAADPFYPSNLSSMRDSLLDLVRGKGNPSALTIVVRSANDFGFYESVRFGALDAAKKLSTHVLVDGGFDDSDLQCKDATGTAPVPAHLSCGSCTSGTCILTSANVTYASLLAGGNASALVVASSIANGPKGKVTLLMAQAKGIPVVGVDSHPNLVVGGLSPIAFFSDNGSLGKKSAELMQKVVTSGDVFSTGSVIERAQGFEAALAGSGLAYRGHVDIPRDGTGSLDKITEKLNMFPNTVAVFNTNGTRFPFLFDALQKLGRVERTKLVTVDFNPDTAKQLEARTLAAIVAQRGYWQGYLAVLTAYSLTTAGPQGTFALMPAMQDLTVNNSVVGKYFNPEFDVVDAGNFQSYRAYLTNIGVP
jgi:ABC-type sugar transport system substrate-binding protein